MTEPQIPPALAAFLTSDLPEPIKALAGIAVSVVEETRELPQRIGSLPTSVVSQMAAKSLRVQQQYAEWVAKGEDFLSSLQEPSDDIPEWATFDEDLPRPPANVSADVSDIATEADLDAPPAEEPSPRTRPPAKKSAPAKKGVPAKKSAPAKKAAPATKSALATKGAPAKKAPAKKAPAKRAAARKPGQVGESLAPDTAASEQVTPLLPPRKSTATPRTGPEVMPEFDTLTIPQLRARLKTLKLDELHQLVEHERSAAGRGPIISMLQARIDTLSS